jgi:hypothetical protein
LARLQRAELERQSQAAVRKALAESEPEEKKGKAAAGGDPDRMRGVPIQAKGVSGAIRGTKPGANLS